MNQEVGRSPVGTSHAGGRERLELREQITRRVVFDIAFNGTTNAAGIDDWEPRRNMRVSSNIAPFRFDFRVNEIEFRQGQLHPPGNDPADFQIIIEHPFLGPFAVHEEFVFELRSGDCAGTWERVSLEQLKVAILRASRNDYAKPARGGQERTREDLGRASGNCPVARSEHLPRIPVEGDSGHVDRAEAALSLGNVRYQIVGGIGSGGRVWGHATFLVDSLPEARAHLLRAGFVQSPESQCLLIDSENGWKIHLLEKSPENRSASLTG